MADKSYYQSEFTGEQIDAAIGIIISGNVDQAAQIATEQANRATEEADRAEFAADRAEQMGGKTSYIGDNGNWFEWDYATGEYVDSGKPSRGPQGPEGVADTATIQQVIAQTLPTPISVDKGGTGATTPADALAALGAASVDLSNVPESVFASLKISKIATGSYTGDGNLTKTVIIGFKPLFFIVQNDSGSAENSVYSGQGGKLGSSVGSRTYTVTDTSITIQTTSDSYTVSDFNGKNTIYYWVAIG